MNNKKLFLKAGLLSALLLVAACGQKGPLYLEDKKESVTTSTSTSTSAEESTETAEVQ